MLRSALALLALLAFVASGCRTEPTETRSQPAPEASGADAPILDVSTFGGDQLPDSATIARDRYTRRMRQMSEVEIDTAAQAEAERTNPETLASVDTTRTWANRLHLPLGGDVEGPSVLKLQVLLDRAHFSPGQIDGQWGDNTESALVWFQKSADLKASGVADSATVRALSRRAGNPRQLVVEHTLTAEEVAGPFEPLPSDVYEKAKLDRLGYESLGEALGERFHAAPALLSRLNDGATLDSLKAGDTLRVPNLDGAPEASGEVARIVVSGAGHYLHALTSDGRVLFHAPTTLGAEYDPSPSGDFEVDGHRARPHLALPALAALRRARRRRGGHSSARSQQRRRDGLDRPLGAALRHPRHARAGHHRLRDLLGLHAPHQLGRGDARRHDQRRDARPLPRHQGPRCLRREDLPEAERLELLSLWRQRPLYRPARSPYGFTGSPSQKLAPGAMIHTAKWRCVLPGAALPVSPTAPRRSPLATRCPSSSPGA